MMTTAAIIMQMNLRLLCDNLGIVRDGGLCLLIVSLLFGNALPLSDLDCTRTKIPPSVMTAVSQAPDTVISIFIITDRCVTVKEKAV